MGDLVDFKKHAGIEDLTPGQPDARLVELAPEELDVVLRLLGNKLPPVLAVLRDNECGWKSIMSVACYLLAATFNRHPDYLPAAFSLLGALESFYPQAEAEFAKQNPVMVSKLIEENVAFFVLPQHSATVKTN